MLLIVVLAVAHAFIIGALSPDDSVITFAANQLAATLAASNRFLLDSLYAAERAGVDASNTHAVYEAARRSRRQHEPAWHAHVAREFSRRAAFVPDGGVQCQPLADDEVNATTFTAAGFLGDAVFLESTMYIDVDCDEKFVAGRDIALSSIDPSVSNTSSNGTLQSLIVLELVQSTFDTRFKRLLTLVPLANSSDTGLFFQPGLSTVFLPTMAAFQVGTLTSASVGAAMYANEGSSEAQISLIEAFDARCTSGAESARFNAAPIDLRLGLGTNNSDTKALIAGLTTATPVFGQCTSPETANQLVNNSNADLIGGIFFIDSNDDGFRNPRETTATVFGVLPLVLQNGQLSNAVEISQNNNGIVLGVVTNATELSTDLNLIRASGGAVHVLSDTAPASAFIGKLTAAIDTTDDLNLVKDAAGNINVSSTCGNFDPRIGVTDLPALNLTSGQDLDDVVLASIFANTAQRDTSQLLQSAALLGEQTGTTFRLSNNNIGFVCARTSAQDEVNVVANCDNATLSADQLEIVDTYTIKVANNTPAFQTWLATSTARAVANTSVDNVTLFEVLPFMIGTDAADVFSNSITNVTDLGAVVRIDISVPNLADRDVSTSVQFTFNIVVITPYARASEGLNCSGVAGAEIVTELVLTDIDQLTAFAQIGSFGGLCRHTQPAECVGGGAPSSNNTDTGNGNGTPLLRAREGILPIAAIYGGFVLIAIVVAVAIAAQ